MWNRYLPLASVFLVLFFLACTTGSGSLDRPFSLKSGDTLTIGFFNVENLFDGLDDPAINDEQFVYGKDPKLQYSPEKYQIKLNNLAQVIEKMGDRNGPEILGLSEVENATVLKDLVANSRISAYGYQICHFNSPDERGIDCALLYKSSAFTLVSATPIPVSLPDNDKTRDILYVKGLIGKKDTLHLFVNHWPSRRGGSEESAPLRMIAAQTVWNTVSGILLKQPGARIAVMGDLNDDPTDPSVRQGMHGSCTQVTNVASLYNPFCELHKPDAFGTLMHEGRWNLFDQILISKTLQSGKGPTLKRASVYKPDYMVLTFGERKGASKRSVVYGKFKEDGYSDHFPVFINLVAGK